MNTDYFEIIFCLTVAAALVLGAWYKKNYLNGEKKIDKDENQVKKDENQVEKDENQSNEFLVVEEHWTNQFAGQWILLEILNRYGHLNFPFVIDVTLILVCTATCAYAIWLAAQVLGVRKCENEQKKPQEEEKKLLEETQKFKNEEEKSQSNANSGDSGGNSE